MKTIRIFFFSTLIIIFGCKEDEPTSPEENDNTAKTDIEIGPEGGELMADEVILKIPPGYLTSSSELKLEKVTGKDPTLTSEATEVFSIDGIPPGEGALRIALKYSGTLSGDSYIAVGSKSFPISLNRTDTAYYLYPAIDSSGYLVASVTFFNQEQHNLNKSTGETEDWMTLVGQTNLHDIESTEKHFKIIGKKDKVTKDKMEQLGIWFENAYKEFSSRGFELDKRKKWPAHVFIRDIPGGSAQFTFNLYSDVFGFIEIDEPQFSKYFNAYETISGHELFHLIQDLYDPRKLEDKIGAEDLKKLWLDEATATFSELYFSDIDDVPSSFYGSELQPILGIHKEGRAGADRGYGCSSLIHYLLISSATAFDEDVQFFDFSLKDIYEEIENGKHPMKTILDLTGGGASWYDNFVYALMTEQVYKLKEGYWIDKINYTNNFYFEIKSSTENKKQFLDVNYEGPGSSLFKIDLNYPNMKKNAAIKFNMIKGGGNYVGFQVYKFNDDKDFYLVTKSSKTEVNVVIDNPKELMDEGWDLIATVTNNYTEPPYTGLYDIDFEVELIEPLEFSSCFFVVREINGKFLTEYEGGGSETGQWTHSKGFPTFAETIIESGENKITQSHDFTGSDEIHYTGSTEIVFSSKADNSGPDYDKIESFTAYSKLVDDDRYYGYTEEYTLSGKNIPISSKTDNFWSYELSGDQTCTYINTMTWYKDWGSRKETLQQDWTCDNETELEVSIYLK